MPSSRLQPKASLVIGAILLGLGFNPLDALAKDLQPQLMQERIASPQRLVGSWVLTDNDNVPFDLILRADGSSLTVIGLRQPTLGRPQRMTRNQLMERGRWQVWGNGIRSDYADGWIDTIQIGPAGPVQWSWKPGSSLNDAPTNHGKAVKLQAPWMGWVGAYRLEPAQPELPPYDAVLTSSGLAFNDIDQVPDGSWSVRADGSVLIQWTSGWRTVIAMQLGVIPRQGDVLSVLQWRPGASITEPASAVRKGERY